MSRDNDLYSQDYMLFDILKEKSYFLGPYWKKHHLSMELLSNSLWQIELKLFDEKGKVTEPEEIFLL